MFGFSLKKVLVSITAKFLAKDNKMILPEETVVITEKDKFLKQLVGQIFDQTVRDTDFELTDNEITEVRVNVMRIAVNIMEANSLNEDIVPFITDYCMMRLKEAEEHSLKAKARAFALDLGEQLAVNVQTTAQLKAVKAQITEILTDLENIEAKEEIVASENNIPNRPSITEKISTLFDSIKGKPESEIEFILKNNKSLIKAMMHRYQFTGKETPEQLEVIANDLRMTFFNSKVSLA